MGTQRRQLVRGGGGDREGASFGIFISRCDSEQKPFPLFKGWNWEAEERKPYDRKLQSKAVPFILRHWFITFHFGWGHAYHIFFQTTNQLPSYASSSSSLNLPWRNYVSTSLDWTLKGDQDNKCPITANKCSPLNWDVPLVVQPPWWQEIV